jgi:hypothetical protein
MDWRTGVPQTDGRPRWEFPTSAPTLASLRERAFALTMPGEEAARAGMSNPSRPFTTTGDGGPKRSCRIPPLFDTKATNPKRARDTSSSRHH